jgi:hypothetical protein
MRRPNTSFTGCFLPADLKEQLDRYAEVNTEGNMSFALRKLLTQALQAEAGSQRRAV